MSAKAPPVPSAANKAAKAAEKAKRKAEFEAKRAAELKHTQQAVGDAIVPKSDMKKQRREQQDLQRAAKSGLEKNAVKEKGAKRPVNAVATVAVDVPKPATDNKLPAVAEAQAVNLAEGLKALTLKEDEVRNSLFPQIPVRCHDVGELTKNLGVKGDIIHSTIIKAGVRMNLNTITGSTPRSLALMVGLKALISDYKTPAGKAMDRDLPERIDRCMEFLNRCRPLTMGMANGAAYIRRLATRVTVDQSEQESRNYLTRMIDEYIEDEINCAMKSITQEASSLIGDGDVILTIGCSLKIKHALYAAIQAGKQFKVIVVDCGPDYRGLEMLTFLTEISKDLNIRYIYVNSIMHIMNDVSKVIVGGHGVLANGYVIAGMGCSQVALVAKSHNVPFIVCCETNEFADAVHTDAFVFNEAALATDYLTTKNHKLVKFIDSENSKKKNLTLLNLLFDATPPEYVSMIVTEKGIFPCHAVPAIIRRNYIKLQ